jgi:hypothetical protein
MTTIINKDRFEQLIQDALAQEFSGWDFSYLHGRMLGDAPAWDYGAIVKAHLPGVHALLDYDTGGGEFLSALTPRPALTSCHRGLPAQCACGRATLAAAGHPRCKRSGCG